MKTCPSEDYIGIIEWKHISLCQVLELLDDNLARVLPDGEALPDWEVRVANQEGV